MPTIPTILLDPVYEGGSHRYRGLLDDEDGSAIQLAAITDIRGWLDDDETGVTINGRANVPLLGQNGGALVTEVVAGVSRAVFYWYLTSADAPIVSPANVTQEIHRITLKFTYTRPASAGSGLLPHVTKYPIIAVARHP